MHKSTAPDGPRSGTPASRFCVCMLVPKRVCFGNQNSRNGHAVKEPDRNEVLFEEGTFSKLFHAGAVRDICLVFELDGRRCSIQYINGGQKPGFIITKRGDVKLYRVETAMQYLHAVGVGSVRLELHNYDPEAKQKRLIK